MKRAYTPLLLSFLMMFAVLPAMANRVIVKGQVKYSNGNPAPNRRVMIMTDTLVGGTTCLQFHQRYTDSSGFYRDTIECLNTITRLRITTENCNGTMLVQEPAVPQSNVVESNFTICLPAPTSCTAHFISDRVPNTLTINFFSSGSTGTSPSDSITRRRWSFGTGDTLGGNRINTAYTYRHRGHYQVCLTIWTAAGCEKQICKTVSLVDSTPPVTQCRAKFSYATPVAVSNGFNTRFNSDSSETAIADTIRERVWTFGDGSSLSGNNPGPSHVYARDGVYTVCLTIKTNRGCQSQQCQQVVVTGNANQCAARFTFEKIATKRIRFNSSLSYSAGLDSIVERKWNFGDGSAALSGNIMQPVKEYMVNGSYNACLSIKTKSGCISTTCNLVRIGDSTTSPTNEQLQIVSVGPNPAVSQLSTVVWSMSPINAEFSVHDIYGVKKWSIIKPLQKGNNTTIVPTSALLSGPYFFRVTTMYGVRSKSFYKL
ncbi:PKD domain-containing protein [Segetibacter sp. 3557_3]|uniref:PKD domain-containing protein n=1 Tax=Segetibacter sp. 3557_3 TaxID=2547429 RepID=UPI0010591B78|nr:PKD domain-containing protein [Segetibacter sp. 3557_3]TDH26168.1 PKD domain-containing protein [Segetibacter sp. 3557_3]